LTHSFFIFNRIHEFCSFNMVMQSLSMHRQSILCWKFRFNNASSLSWRITEDTSPSAYQRRIHWYELQHYSIRWNHKGIKTPGGSYLPILSCRECEYNTHTTSIVSTICNYRSAIQSIGCLSRWIRLHGQRPLRCIW
jgi:hypothetical protein